MDIEFAEVAAGAPENAPEHISAAFVGGKGAVGDGERESPDMVRGDPEGHAVLLVVFFSGEFLDTPYKGAEYV